MSSFLESSSTPVPALHRRIVEELRHAVRRDHFDTWFRGVRLDRVDGERYVLTTPSVFVRDWLRRNYLGLIENAVKAAAGVERCEVLLQLDRAAVTREIEGDQEQPVELVAAEAGAAECSANGGSNAGDSKSAGGSSDVPSVGQPRSGGFSVPSRIGDSLGGAARSFGASGRDAGREGGITNSNDTHMPSGRARGTTRPVEGSFGDLNNNYTFEQFVVGPCNRLAHAAALAVGDNPGRAYNPLFIHGNVGLGKTHLLQASCHAIRRRGESARVLYLSCEDFTNRFIHSIQSSKLDEFRDFHRSVDVLVIDDIQFLANKEKTQDEFFHTFNSLYNSNRQIIISSDRSPTEIPTIEERLVSRFKWGLVAEMELPCFETRVAIVKRKARTRQVEMPDDVAYFVAERIDTNIRELEGAVIKVIGVASITEREITAELAEEALRGVAVTRNRQVSLPDIMGLVTGEFSISARELTGKRRTQAVSLPRQICMFLCRQHTDQSLEEIGRFFGNRDHTTVLYAVQKIGKRVKDDRMFRELVHSLSARLTS